ncbi:ST3 beta-galactoside alpha-2,3-sialyltransferase 7 [Trichomycterus rosablanca]|uniref:ST3 beta-galactoside alpha-2,3-sialyltransferase 7 n=1 Tax=Trichomycterus rosablanca TaxID=2290929 RepID=UPI002F358851
MTFKHLSVKTHEEDCSPLLTEAKCSKCPNTKHRRTDPPEFLLSKRQNIALSIALLLSCYSVILVPAYLPTKQPTLTESSTEEFKAVVNSSAVLLSNPCKSGWTKVQLQKVQRFQNLLQIPVFLHNGTGFWDMPPPLGLQGTKETLVQTLRILPNYGLPSGSDKCRRCIVVGSGGILRGKHLGAHIDKYDIIIRLNNAPIFGFEKDAGSRTTIRLIYPEGAPISKQEYQNTDIIALVAFKRLDLEWLSSVVTRKPLSWWSKLWFWRDVINEIPLEPGNFRILNPEILKRIWNVLLTYTELQRKIVPTLGIGGVVLALQLCDEVSLAGFGYDLKHPGAWLHYYETLRMDHMMVQVVHDVSAEGSFLRDLIKAGVVHDLTGAL